MMKLTLSLLGGFEVCVNDSEPVELPTRKARALLAWLALNPGRRIGREAAAALLWGDSPQKQANASLSQAFHSLRKVLSGHGCYVLESDNETILFAPDGAKVDALRFSLLASARDYDGLEDAERLYRGAFLDGVPAPTPEFEDWMTTERRRLGAEAVDALTVLLEQRAERGESTALAATARRLFELDPYNEPAARALMLHHAARGQIGLATEVLEMLCRRLSDDLDAAPSGEMAELHERILRHEFATPADAPAAARAPSQPPPTPARAIPPAFMAAAALAVAVGAMWWQPWAPDFKPLDPATMEHPLPAKPSIAVLAFADLSTGDDQGYLSDAISEGITAELSRFSELFVIAWNSSSRYRDKATDVRDIATNLGVHYVLAGSQRKDGDRLRVTVQLIDALKGNYIKAETYDRKLADLFAVQDEIVRAVASWVGAEIAFRPPPSGNLARVSALRYHLKARQFFRQFTPEGTEQARLLDLKAIEVDPTSAFGYIGLTFIYINGYRWGWTELDRDEALARAKLSARKALELEPSNYNSHNAMANVHMQYGDQDQAIARFQKSLALNRSATNVMANLAEAFGYAGRMPEAIEWLHKAMRLDPHHPDWFYWNLGWAQWYVGACDDALVTMRKMSSMPNLAHRMMAIIHVCLGQPDQARAAIAELLKKKPNYSIAEVRLNFRGKYKNPADLERYIDGLRIAGLPEVPPSDTETTPSR